jgi:chemotaxis protein MotB
MKHPPVIIVKKSRPDANVGRHGEAWKVAYADFVTALMAFFLVMWLVTQGNAVKQAVGGYFRDPGIFDQRARGIVPSGQVAVERGKPTARMDSPRIGQQAARKALEEAAGRLKELLGELPEFKKLEDQIEIQLTSEGLRIELVESAKATFFDSGSATLKPVTAGILATIASELGKLSSPVVVEGHTDSLPYSRSGPYTNWELSADRANAARRAMEASGLRKGQIRAVRGYADVQLRDPGHPNAPHNRRVSIVVQSADFAPPVDRPVDALAASGASTRRGLQ